ncbi:MAG: DUF5603 domain-containing protein [Desulfurococcus sp.]|nr:DUF5603 domain-containing protein [Desulfurococcus sp.]
MSSESGRVIIKLPKTSIPYKYIEPVLIDIDNLVIHEEIVEARLKELTEKIRRENAVDMPIVVAPIPGTSKYLIVDGHHRWAAVKALGYRRIPCIVIDYYSPDVKLKTWLPGIIGDVKPVLEEVARRGLKTSTCDYTIDSVLELDPGLLEKSSFIVLGRELCVAINGGIEGQKIVSRVLSDLNLKDLVTLVYYGELVEAVEDLKTGWLSYLFVRKALTKEDVMNYVKNGGVYAPKTTRHILPFYPAKTYTPLDKLQ